MSVLNEFLNFFKLLFSEFLFKYVIDKKQFEKGKACRCSSTWKMLVEAYLKPIFLLFYNFQIAKIQFYGPIYLSIKKSFKPHDSLLFFEFLWK